MSKNRDKPRMPFLFLALYVSIPHIYYKIWKDQKNINLFKLFGKLYYKIWKYQRNINLFKLTGQWQKNSCPYNKWQATKYTPFTLFDAIIYGIK